MSTKPIHPSSAQPARHHIHVLGQLLKYIPRSIVNTAAIEHGVDSRARTFSIFSHMAAMIFVQLAMWTMCICTTLMPEESSG